MNKLLKVILVAAAMLGTAVTVQGCATAKGAAAGAAIGSLAGDTHRGAEIGATAGFVVDVFD